MPNYYNITTFERKDIAQELIDLWTETSNPKLGEYELTPPAPSPDAVWDNGQWVIPVPATYTAEAWLQLNGYGGTQLTTLLSLQTALGNAGKTSAKLNSVHTWTNQILSSFITNPEVRTDWPECPFEFYDTTKEAFELLNQ